MTKHISKIFLILSLISTTLFSMQENEIKNIMTKKINAVTNILITKHTKEEKTTQIFKIMDEVFDYKLMSKISLGRIWKKLSTSKQKSFTKAFEQKLKTSYVDKLALYKNQEILIKELKKTKSTRALLYTEIIGKGETFKVNYKFRKNKKSQWLIYDVELLGISIMLTYRKQFAGFLKTKSFDELLESL